MIVGLTGPQSPFVDFPAATGHPDAVLGRQMLSQQPMPLERLDLCNGHTLTLHDHSLTIVCDRGLGSYDLPP